MTATWKTKWGVRRVRHDPPTLAEAFAAAACLTDDRDQQAGIAADLMGISVADARAEAARLAREDRATITVLPASRDKARPRTVVVERKPARRLATGASPAQERSGTGASTTGRLTLRSASGCDAPPPRSRTGACAR